MNTFRKEYIKSWKRPIHSSPLSLLSLPCKIWSDMESSQKMQKRRIGKWMACEDIRPSICEVQVDSIKRGMKSEGGNWWWAKVKSRQEVKWDSGWWCDDSIKGKEADEMKDGREKMTFFSIEIYIPSLTRYRNIYHEETPSLHCGQSELPPTSGNLRAPSKDPLTPPPQSFRLKGGQKILWTFHVSKFS